MTAGAKTLSCGIDLGTTNSTLAIVRNGKPEALNIDPQNSNAKILKTLIYMNPKGDVDVGQGAVERYLWDVKNIPSQKPRLVNTGRMIKTFGPSSGSGVGPPIWVPEIIEVDESGRGRLIQSLKSVLTSENFKGTDIFGQFYSVETLLGKILGEIKRRAEDILQSQISRAVLGRPVRYVGEGKEELALERMRLIAQNAGFKEISFEYEPVGAALNYGLDLTEKSKVLVFDFGGGTLDICIMEFPGNKILAVSGRPIGGDLLNSIIVKNKLIKHLGAETIISGKYQMPRHFYNAFNNWYQLTLLKNVKGIEALEYFVSCANKPELVDNLRKLIINDWGYGFFREADKSKIELSDREEVWFRFEETKFLIEEKVTKNEFEAMIENELEETEEVINESLQAADLKTRAIDKVLITGGSSKIPIFRKLLIRMFGEEKLAESDRFTSVALGLALRAEEEH